MTDGLESRGFSARLRRGEWLTALVVAATVAVFAAVGAVVGWRQVAAQMLALDPGTVAGLLGLSLANYAVRLVRWQLYTRRLAIGVSAPRNALYYVAGFSMTATPGKLGETVRLWLLRRGCNVPYIRSAPLLIADRVADANAVAVLCLASLAGFGDYLKAGIGFGIILVACNVLLLWPSWLRAALGLGWKLLGRAKRLFAGLRSVLTRARRLFAPDLLAAGLVLGLLGWSAECAALYWTVTAMGATVSPSQAAFVFTFSMLLGTAAMTPGGLGGTEALMVALLTGLNVPMETAFAATAVVRLTTLWFSVALGFAALPFALKATPES